MKSLQPAAGALSALALGMVVCTLAPGGVAANKVVGMDIVKVRGSAMPAIEGRNPRLRGRSTVTTELENGGVGYFAKVSVGTPGQTMNLQIDTGSSDIWVPSLTADLCQEDPSECKSGTFNSKKSSTFSELAPGDFSIAYMDGTGVAGDYISDTLAMGSTAVKNLTMGLATNFTEGPGVMGIGYTANEAVAQGINGQTYPNIIDKMVSEGLINTKAYSLWLNDLDANTGSILFGGIDTEKYEGSLTELPISKDSLSGQFLDFTVTLTSVNITGAGSVSSSTSSSFANPVVLDCGTSLTYLPSTLTQQIYQQVGATYSRVQGAGLVPCDLAERAAGTTINYGFGGDSNAVIKVPIEELVLSSGDRQCIFGIQPSASESDPSLLGDTFLRSAFVVFNLDNNAIYMAQTNFNATKTNIKEITSGTSGVPDVSGVASGVTAAQSFTGIPRVGSASGTASSGAPGTSAGFPRVELAAWFGVVAVSATCMMIGGSWFLWI